MGSDKCTDKKMAELKKVGQQAKNLGDKVQKLGAQLQDMNKKRLEAEKLAAEGKHTAWYSNLAENQARVPNSVFLPKPFSLAQLTNVVQRQLS